MDNYVMLVIKGFFIGLAKIIPGVSGATLAITLGLYEKGISAISNFRKNKRENIKFLLPLALGFALAILLASKLIKKSLELYYFQTMFLFVGLIMGGVPALLKTSPQLSKNKSNIITMFIACLLIIVLSLLTNNTSLNSFSQTVIPSIHILIVLGMIEAITIIIPGVSGTGILMILGYYYLIINTLSSLTNFNSLAVNIRIIIPFGFGIFIGIILMAKLMNYLFFYHKEKTYSAIIGFTISSIIVLFLQSFNVLPTFSEFLIAFLLLIFGFIAAYKLE